MATIGDVARCAGVSVATVSRVINEENNVSEKTRKTVLRAIEELQYVPNMLGVGLRKNQSNMIIVLMNTISNIIYANMMEGISASAAARGYRIIIGNTNGLPESEQDYCEIAKKKLADGVILLSPSMTTRTVNKYADNFPVVVCGCMAGNLKAPAVLNNDDQAAYDATCYLLNHGHKHIGFMGLNDGSLTAQNRESGYRRALRQAGIADEERYIIRSGYDFSSGEVETHELLERTRNMDAVFCATDLLAFNTIKTAQKMGYAVPKDISVIGFDDSAYALLSSPTITTVQQNLYEIGYQAMERMYALLQVGKRSNPRVQYVPHKIVVRDSTRDR